MNKNLASVLGSFSGRQLVCLFVLFAVFCFSLLGVVWQWSTQFLVEVPKSGGYLTEGVIGLPRFVNPILATSDVDRDLVGLIYSGLFRLGTDGQLVPDLAASLAISDDHLVYTVRLKDNLYWHDGAPLNAQDVIFTLTQLKNPIIKSPRLSNWDGVIVTAPDEKTVIFALKQPYAAFTENLTLGLLPEHLWGKVAAENFPFSPLNIRPIGSGPYLIEKIHENRDKIKNSYELAAFPQFALGAPKIKKFQLRFYPGEAKLLEAYESGEIEALATVGPVFAAREQDYSMDSNLWRSALPRVFGVFLNQNQASLFARKEVRQALSRALDRERLVEDILAGFGSPLLSPLPVPDSLSALANSASDSEAATTLTEAGWKLKEPEHLWMKTEGKDEVILEFTLATADVPELKAVAERLKSDWDKFGARVELRVFEIGDLNEKIIRPRDYEALLFGEVVGREPDLFAFWHSSQRLDPGLNIALYTNTKADKILEEARVTINPETRHALHEQFAQLVAPEYPAIFLYTPDFLYLLPRRVMITELPVLNVPGERFANIHSWYIETEKVWPIFATENNN